MFLKERTGSEFSMCFFPGNAKKLRGYHEYRKYESAFPGLVGRP